MGTIVSEHPIVFVEEFGGSPSCPAQHRCILSTKRNGQTILAIVGVIKTTRGRLNPRQRKLVQLPSRPLPAHHRGHSCLTNLLFDVGPSSEGTQLSAKIAARVALHFPPAAEARKAGLELPISSDRWPPPISIDPRIGAIRCLNKRAPLLTLLPKGRQPPGQWLLLHHRSGNPLPVQAANDCCDSYQKKSHPKSINRSSLQQPYPLQDQ